MKSTGIVRKVDELGRIVLPVELRRTMDIAEKDPLEIYVDGNSIVLRKYRPSCIFCDSTKDVRTFRGKNVCPRCLRELREAPGPAVSRAPADTPACNAADSGACARRPGVVYCIKSAAFSRHKHRALDFCRRRGMI